MKCIYCGTNTRYRVRQDKGGRCDRCGHQFAFEPRNNSLKVTDALFQGSIQGLSGESKLFFTERQLWYEFDRHLARRRQWWRIPVYMAIASVVASIFFSNLTIFLVLGIITLAVAVALYSYYQRGPTTPIVTFEVFRSQFLGAWTQIHGPIEKLLSALPREPHQLLEAKEPDLTAYSFNRALVTSQAEIAAMLIANRFHSENNCAILSLDGYPYNRTDSVLTMLRRNPQLMVYTLHDASVEGCRLSLRLRQPDWFPESTVVIFDLGLFPRQAEAQKLSVINGLAQTIPNEVRQKLIPKEVAWLEQGNVAELAAVRPAQLMRAIYQGFGRSRTRSEEKGESANGDDRIIWIRDIEDSKGDDDDDEANGFG